MHELRSFLGLCTYYRRFVKGFSSIARPLHRLTENKQKFLWTDECEEAFNSLKAALTSSPILVYPDPEKQFILDTDASHESVGAVLSQEINGQEHVIAYWSKCLSKPERNYCVTRKELLAIVKAVENFHSYLYGRKFLLRTDHASLTWLLNFKNTEGQISRWIQKLEEYDFEIKHRKGSLHDDIIIVGKSFEEHLSNLRRVFEKLKEAKLKLNPSKCNLFRHEVNYLGHIISADGVRTDPQKVSAVKDWRRPKNMHELRSFLGLCTYYRRFVKGFSSIARPLHRLTENKQKFLWTDECEEAFNSLKAALTSSPILVYPDPEKQFILDTDASHESVGAVLSQEINGQEHVIAYWSKCLSKPERNYCVTRKELLAIVKAVENFHSYLYGRKFLLRTDHASLTWLLNFKNTEGQISRWIQKLEEYDFEIKHRKGSLHGNADALSRRPCSNACSYCTTVEKKYDITPVIRQIKDSVSTQIDRWSDEEVREA
ncbi:retrovirus-related Pol polyprotein from transposon 17.6 [Trichonephila clavata]|uniref:RNA-directed DNA polymerase n=1 Tax=Trichonephila clavata TaxID=2740835 RepID=A0A8X6ISP7_TRICU|nr:retrovirus-related Pol polyprotein from transposon 17.6 [Trichonephila clavata]